MLDVQLLWPPESPAKMQEAKEMREALEGELERVGKLLLDGGQSVLSVKRRPVCDLVVNDIEERLYCVDGEYECTVTRA
jgi:hypothetical protein